MAEIRFALRDFVGVVGEGVVNAAAVDVKILPKMLHADAGAFDVPARISHTPGRIPLELLILKFGLCEPKHEVCLVALIVVRLHAFAHAHGKVFFLMLVKDVVLIELRGIEVNVAARLVGIAAFNQPLDQADVFLNAIRCRFNNVRPLDVQLPAVFEKRVRIVFRDFHNRFVLALCALEHLVLARVGIRRKVADIRNVHDALDVVAAVAEILLQHILHDVGAQVADVREVIHRGPTGVHLYDVRMVGDEFLFPARCGVIELHESSFKKRCR